MTNRGKWIVVVVPLALLVLLVVVFRDGSRERIDERLRVREEFIDRMNSGRNFLDQGRAEEAASAFAAASLLNPNDRDAWLNLANAHLALGAAPEAARAASTALAIDRHSAAGHYLLGCSLLRQGSYAEAVPSLQTAKDLDRTVNAVSFQLGRAHLGSEQFPAAMDQFLEVVRFDPEHRAAWYSLSQAQLRMGDEEGARTSRERFAELAAVRTESPSGPAAFEACIHTEAVVPFRLEQPEVRGIPVRFEEATADLLGRVAHDYRSPFGILDVGRDGELDLLVRGVDGFELLRPRDGTFVSGGPPLPGPPDALYTRCRIGDLQIESFMGEGKMEDVCLSGPGGILILQVTEDGQLFDRSAFSRIDRVRLSHATLADLDFTGKLDIVGIGPDGALTILGNRGNFSYVDASGEYRMPSLSRTPTEFWLEDWDGDDLPDLLLLHRGESPRLWLRQRGSAFAVPPEPPSWPRARTMVPGDLDNDLRPDLVLDGPEGLVVRLQGSTETTVLRTGSPPAAGIRLLDYDNDGWLDILVMEDRGLSAWRNRGLAGFEEVTRDLGLDRFSSLRVRTLRSADLDGDCDSDLLLGLEDGALRILRNQGGSVHRQLKVRLVGNRSNPSALGVKVEVASGGLRLIRTVRELPVEIGLGSRDRVELLKPHWSDLVTTTDVSLEGCRTVDVVELELPTGSCPYLYVWNGERFRFVSDFLGASPLGLPMARGRLIPADTDEFIRLGSGHDVGLQDGDWVVQVTEELREILYLDEAALHVVDHPAEVEVHATNRLVPLPPFPEAGIRAVHRPRTLRAARRSDGLDVREHLLAADGRRVSPVRLRPPQHRGLAEPWHIDLDFGPIDEERDWVLLMEGWLRFGGGMANMSASHFVHYPFPFPTLSARGEDGTWRPLEATLGAPAGKTKSMAVDLGGVLRPGMRHLRLSMAFDLYWDRISLMEAWEGNPVRHVLRPRVADLHWRGFSEFRDLPRDIPLTPDYDRVRMQAPWTVMPSGWCTRYGPVGSLLESTDDRLVLLSGGDELTLRFDSTQVPPLPSGHRRDLFLFVDGWDKDADPHVVEGWTVGPLPWHGMDDALYGRQERPREVPDDWVEEYNTRWTGPFLLHRKESDGME